MPQVLAPVGAGSNNGEVIALADGAYMAVWTHMVSPLIPITNVTDDQFTAVLGRVFNANGSPRGDVFQVNQSTAASGQGEADLVLLSNGNVAVVWTDGPNLADGDVAARGRIIAADGTPVTDAFDLSTRTDGDQRLPQVAAADNGGFVATWSEGGAPFSNTDERWIGQQFDASGNRIDSEVFFGDQDNVQDGELLRLTDTAYSMVGGGGRTVIPTETWDWFEGIQASTTSTTGFSDSSTRAFGFDDDAISDGNGNAALIFNGFFQPGLNFRSVQVTDNSQTGDYPDGTPASSTVTFLHNTKTSVVGPSMYITFDGELSPPGVDFTVSSPHYATTAATYLPNGNIVVVWTAVSGGTALLPEFSLFAATVSDAGIQLSSPVVIAQDVQGTAIAPPFVAANGNDSVFIGWTGTTTRNGEGTNELMGDVFDVPSGLTPELYGTPGNDTIVGDTIGDDPIYMLGGDDVWQQDDATETNGVFGMRGDDVFEISDVSVLEDLQISGGLGRDALDMRGSGVALSDYYESPIQFLSNNDDIGVEIMIGTNFADTMYVPRVNETAVAYVEDSERDLLVHGHNGNDTIVGSYTTDFGGVVDGGNGTDVLTFGRTRDSYELVDEGTYYTIGLYEVGFDDPTPFVRDTNRMVLRSIESIEFSDQTVNLNTTASRSATAVLNSLGTPPVPTAGNDVLTGTGAADTVDLLAGNDRYTAGAGNDVITAGAGNDVVLAQGGNDTVTGNQGNDTLLGHDGNDRLDGGVGNDSLSGGNGDDILIGGGGLDTLRAGGGDDTVNGGNGRDLAYLGAGDDLFVDNGQGGTGGRDTVFGGAGNDTIGGGGGNDRFDGQAGNDILKGRVGNDKLYGGNGNDTLEGGGGNDTVAGGNGRDRAFLGNGNDRWFDNAQSQFGGDYVAGGNGNDTFNVGGGNDTLVGGSGADVFVFGTGIDNDRINDFAVGTDTLRLEAGLWDGALNQARLDAQSTVTGGNLVLDFGAGDSITLIGLTSNVGLLGDIDLF